MIVMLDTSHDLDECATELGCSVEQLFTPLTAFNAQHPEQNFAMDNGAFSRFNAPAFIAMLKKHEDRKALCRFVAAPDIIGSAIRTLEAFNYWYPRLRHTWPVALVCQDGQESLPIPWDRIAAVFIGGSTTWKMSQHAAAIVKTAKAVDKWCHVGRVNTPGRYEYFKDLGADSCDGTGLSRYSHMRQAIHEIETSPKLW